MRRSAAAERALNAEMDHHLGEEAQAGNNRNGYGRKTVTTDTGRIEIDVPRDRQGSFDPQLIAKYQRRFPGFDDKIVSMYVRGMSTREITGHLRELYGIDVSPDLISTVTDAVLELDLVGHRRTREAFVALHLRATGEDAEPAGDLVGDGGVVRFAAIAHAPFAERLDASEFEPAGAEDRILPVGPESRVGRPSGAFAQDAAAAEREVAVVAVVLPHRANRLDAVARQRKLAVLLEQPDRRAFAHFPVIGLAGKHGVDPGLEPAVPVCLCHRVPLRSATRLPRVEAGRSMSLAPPRSSGIRVARAISSCGQNWYLSSPPQIRGVPGLTTLVLPPAAAALPPRKYFSLNRLRAKIAAVRPVPLISDSDSRALTSL